MNRSRPWAWVLVVWTFAVWASRLRNAIADGDLTGGAFVQAVAIAAVFVGLAVVLGLGVWRDGTWTAPALIVLVIAGIVRWTIRGPVILASAEWSVGFKVVHTILWLTTVLLSVLAWREGRSLNDRPTADGGYDSGHGSARIGH